MIFQKYFVYSFFVFVLLLIWQVVVFILNDVSVVSLLVFSLFLSVLYAGLLFFPKRGYAAPVFHPVTWITLAFFLSYWIGPISNFLFPPDTSSYLFSFHPDDSGFPLVLAMISYVSLLSGAWVVGEMVNNPRIPRALFLSNISRKLLLYLITAYICLIFFKINFVLNGWVGSLVGFSEPVYIPLHAKLIKPFTEMTVLLFVFLVFASIKSTGNILRVIVVVFFVVEVGLHLAMGDRRDILIYLIPWLSISYFFSRSRVSPLSIVILFLGLVFFYGLATSINQSIDKMHYAGVASAYSFGFVSGVFEFISDPFQGFNKIMVIFQSFTQTHMIDAAITARSQGYNYENAPLLVFLSGLIPGAHSLGISLGDSSDLQWPLYINALEYVSQPNLTNPLPAENYVDNGVVGVVGASFFSGVLMMLFYRISSSSKLLFLNRLVVGRAGIEPATT